MRSRYTSTGRLAFALLTSNFIFTNVATGNETQSLDSNTDPKKHLRTLSSSYIVNQDFDDFVRAHPSVVYQYKLTGIHGRLLGLARRYMTHAEMKEAITEILVSRR
jgi:hypothetical protein